jgi:hypothetical protein
MSPVKYEQGFYIPEDDILQIFQSLPLRVRLYTIGSQVVEEQNIGFLKCLYFTEFFTNYIVNESNDFVKH